MQVKLAFVILQLLTWLGLAPNQIVMAVLVVVMVSSSLSDWPGIIHLMNISTQAQARCCRPAVLHRCCSQAIFFMPRRESDLSPLRKVRRHVNVRVLCKPGLCIEESIHRIAMSWTLAVYAVGMHGVTLGVTTWPIQ
jgi:hypothetical protein